MVVLLSLVACLFPETKTDEGGTDTSDTNGDTDGGGRVSIYDIRDGAVGDGENVTLTGVLVSSPPTREDSESGRSDGFFVQEVDGGAKSGIYVWSQGGFGSELTVQEGDEVTISGRVSEYFGWTELVVGDATSIQITGSGTVPAPVDLGDGAGVDWDAYESVPVTLTNQTIESIDAYNTGTLSAGIKLDDGFVYNDYDCRGSYSSVTGVVFYQYEDWSINNRTEAELVGYTAPEALAATVRDIREGGVCGAVSVSGVIATAESFGEDDGKTWLFVQDPGGGEYSGIVVFVPSAYTKYEVGTTFDVVGSVSDYFGLIEIYVGDTGSLTVTGTGEPTAVSITEAPADWLPYQSALVKLTSVEAVTDLEYGAVLTDKGVYIDNLFFDFEAEAGSTWESVTGPLFYTSYDDIPQFLVEPRSADDLVE